MVSECVDTLHYLSYKSRGFDGYAELGSMTAGKFGVDVMLGFFSFDCFLELK